MDARAGEVAHEGHMLEDSLNNEGQADQIDEVVAQAESNYAEERESLLMRMDQTKASYRALHMEFQLCRKQIEETQILKKRAMNDIVSAYDRLAVHRPQPLD